MTALRKRPFIYVTWLPKYLIGDNLCRWSIWHRIYHYFEKAKSDFDEVRYNLNHTALRNKIIKEYESKGFEVIPEFGVYISGGVAELKGRIDVIAISEDRNLIIEAKTGAPNPSDKIQLMLYIWALPKTKTRFHGAHFDGLLVYNTHEIEISALEIDESFLNHFTQFTKDILSGEPNRKYPSPRECKYCKIGNCDERDTSKPEEIESGDSGYEPDFF